ncbi:MAG: hypothetical protein AAF228_04445 [Pseudomonadota bacterium]
MSHICEKKYFTKKSVEHLLCVGSIICVLISAFAIVMHMQTAIAQYVLDQAWDKALADKPKQAHNQNLKEWQDKDHALPQKNKSFAVLGGINGEAIGHPNTHTAQVKLAANVQPPKNLLQHLALGDKITVTQKDGRKYAFKVTKLKAIGSAASCHDVNASQMPQSDTDLIACWPFQNKTEGLKKYMIEAVRLIEDPVAIIKKKKQNQHES